MMIIKKILKYIKSLYKRLLYIHKEKTFHIVVPPDVWKLRMKLCQNCEDLSVDECGLCGCPIVDKCRWASEQCERKEKKWFEWRKDDGQKERL